MLHHLTLWVPDIDRAGESWGWLLGHLGFDADRPRPRVLLYRHPTGATMVLEQSPDMVPGMLYSRMRPGLNHVAFRAPDASTLSRVGADAAAHGWGQLQATGHSIAAGSRVLYLEDRDGFEVELVAPQS
ncbi:VOC family protein [Acidiferrimicrobium sp. IK]|uniref:VOC family protein n=1 Tax=Acidiferrimicrobium sp. IK TaxID=2871700 RepID=UPI0021CAF97F|nr:VOC family protein [Acidiferrimicrobium sp. IK]MCU4186060.1 VOC family protein [Acidiferrimicrobium sp. IK]